LYAEQGWKEKKLSKPNLDLPEPRPQRTKTSARDMIGSEEQDMPVGNKKRCEQKGSGPEDIKGVKRRFESVKSHQFLTKQ
jgi:hypothetical protein